jgi:EAL and modified HD-GYP domain-containing signal transduction protein
LRTVNSAAHGLRSEVASIGDALLLIGREPVQRWVSIWALAAMAHRSHSELVVMSILRARFCEQLAARRTVNGTPLHSAGGFLLGMCSMLDAVFEQPMEAIVKHLPLGAALRAALLGEDNPWRRLLDCVVSYERADWSAACDSALRAGIRASDLGPAHADAVCWTSDVCRSGATDQAA